MDVPERIAIVGMDGRFPGAPTLGQFWENLRNGVESVVEFTDDELRARGVAEPLLADPRYVKKGTVLDDADMFDAAFFGMSPREAALTDPQQRIFLEAAWAALESAGYDPRSGAGSVGVFAGAGINNYVPRLWGISDAEDPVGSYRRMIGNNPDYVATRVAYLLNLTGPALTVQTACSTSLVAVHLACQSLLTYQCDMALAGGVSLYLPQGVGYTAEDGMILSPDGHCRAFDADGRGIYAGRGLGVVVLKRLSEALEDGDTIRAVINGSAVNNDGSNKIGYTAPSIDGQVEVITTALSFAETPPDTIQYVEAHGTGTPLGDPIEVAALTRAYRASTDRVGYCAIGSVKTNVGHLDAAAGVTGLIKTVLAIEHREIPPSLNFETPNPEIDFEASPFYVNQTLSPWPASDTPRRAAVSSFGIGGTNAHVIVEEAPPQREATVAERPELLVLSARTEASLERGTRRLSDHLARSVQSLADTAYTLQVGRSPFDQRRAVVASDRADAAAVLLDPRRTSTTTGGPPVDGIGFVFSGQGAQYPNMGRALYEHYDVFRDTVDAAAAVLSDPLGLDLRSVLFSDEATAADQLQQTAITQPALFTVEYGLARLWMSWGIEPDALAGHSIGEYVAAALAGVFTLDDALMIVAERGRLMQELPTGSMMAVPLPEAEVASRLLGAVSLAAVNAPEACVVSGPDEAIAALEMRLAEEGLEARRLHTSHAFHSEMMDPMLEAFTATVAGVELRTPTIPVASNVTGRWMTDEEATDPAYWASQVRRAVRFADCASLLLEKAGRAIVEVGPGNTLATLTKRTAASRRVIVTSLPHPREETDARSHILTAVGRLWVDGARVDWPQLHDTPRRRVPLPTYPFERTRHWIDDAPVPRAQSAEEKVGLTDWFYEPSWRRSRASILTDQRPDGTWLVFVGPGGEGRSVADRLRTTGRVVVVEIADSFEQVDQTGYRLRPDAAHHYQRLLEHLAEERLVPDVVAHFWGAGSDGDTVDELARGFYSVLYLAQALADMDPVPSVKLAIVTSHSQSVAHGEVLRPLRAAVHGLAKVVPQELALINVHTIDIPNDQLSREGAVQLDRLIADMADPAAAGSEVAYRGTDRWVRTYEPAPIPAVEGMPTRLRANGVYLITGGLGGVGLASAGYLADVAGASLVLTGRRGLPPRADWERHLADSGPADITAQRIRAVLELEQRGAEVLVVAADVADRPQMAAAFAEAESRFGEVNGVIHAAGVTPSMTDGELTRLDALAGTEQFHPKAGGLAVLEEVIGSRSLDFVLLTSSLSTVLGGFGFGAYAAANSVLDAWAENRADAGSSPYLSIAWDGWNLEELDGPSLSMSPVEGITALSRMLSVENAARLVVSVAPLQGRIERWVEMGRLAPDDSSTAAEFEGAADRAGAPRTEIEARLAAIWQELLGVEFVGIYDDFYDLGGDSLVGMNVVARANRAGIRITPVQLLEHPTVADLAELAEAGRRVAEAGREPDEETDLFVGEVPLTPNTCRFLYERDNPNPHHWNVSVLTTPPVDLDLDGFTEALHIVYRRHDSLRLRFTHREGRWTQRLVAPDDAVPVTTYQLTGSADPHDKLAELIEAEQSSLNLLEGPLMRVALFDLGGGEYRLLFVAHHLAAEGRSLGVILEDLDVAYRAIADGEAPQLPARSTPMHEWAQALQARAADPSWREHLAYWSGVPWPDVRPIPVDHADGANTNESAREVIGRLSAADTARLAEVAAERGCSLEDLLLAALSRTLAAWTEGKTVLFDRMGHGRTPVTTDMDLSRTVGFFLSYTPVVAEVSDSETGFRALDALIAQLQQDPIRSLSFDVLRWMAPPDDPAVETLRAAPRAQISFNYRGATEHWVEEDSIFQLARETDLAWATNHGPDGGRYYPLGIIVDRDADELVARFVYSASMHDEPTVAGLLDRYLGALRDLA